MSSLWLLVWCSALLVLTGCGPAITAPAKTTDDFYLAVPRAVASAGALNVTNEIGGNITILTSHSKEVGADVIATGIGASLEETLEKESSCVSLTNTGVGVSVSLAPDLPPKYCDGLLAQLHVRVPSDTNLSKVSTPAGNVEVHGDVENVTVVIAGKGDIEVVGASGEIRLTTGSGSITADLAPGPNNSVSAQTQNGNVNLIALDALVTASTKDSNIRFLGTLRNARSNNLTISGTGNIDLALPAYATPPADLPNQKSTLLYQVLATTSAQPIIADYPPTVTLDNATPTALTICGFVHSSGPYDYHIENAPKLHFGRIEISQTITATFYFSGTLGDKYYRFDTNRPRISIYAPVPQSIHIYTSDQLNQFMAGQAQIDQGCQAALNSRDPAAIVLNLKADRGRIYFRHIDLKKP